MKIKKSLKKVEKYPIFTQFNKIELEKDKDFHKGD
jgi:hypothetical protein